MKKLFDLFNSNKSLKNLFIYGFGQGFNLITPLLAVPYIVSKCGIANYGKTGVGMAMSFLLIVIIDFGSDIIGVKEVSVNRDDNAKLASIFGTTYAAKFLLTATLIAALCLLFLYVPYFKKEQMMFFLSLPILVGQFVNPIWFLQGIEDFKWITVLNIATKLVYLAGVFLTVKRPEDYIWVNFWWGIGLFVPFFAGSLWCIRKFGVRFASLQFDDIARFIAADYKFCISQLFLSMKNYSPIMLIGFIGGFNTAGQYKIIEQIIMPVRTYLQMIFRFFYPKLCYEIFRDKMRGIAYWKNTNGANFLVILCMLSMIFVFSDEILAFFKVTPVNRQMLSPLLRYALLIPLFITVSFTFEQLLFSIGKRSIYIRITIATVIANFVIMFFLFRTYGLYGLITSLLITEALVIFSYTAILKTFFNHTSKENVCNNI